MLCEQVYARWQTKDDIVIENSVYTDSIIFKDGTFEVEIEEQRKLIKEAGRGYLTKYEIIYPENVVEIRILEAKTINNNNTYIVDKKLIEDKPLASGTHGFDQKRKVSIPFIKIDIGAKAILKYKCKVKKATLENVFSFIIENNLKDYWLIKGSRFNFKSYIPLYVKINDPNKVFKVSHHKKNEGALDVISAEITKSFSGVPIDDLKYGVVDKKNKTWISISSENDWSFAKKYSVKYSKVIDQSLPLKFNKILNEGKHKDSDEEKINYVTSELQNLIQYLGDWKTIEGSNFPRDLERIDFTQYGDCKDFASATAAILKRMGFNAKIALVYRGDIYKDIDFLPGINNFNHAIVYVKNNNGQEYWVDPTNKISMANGIFPDISNRKALILDDIEPLIKIIPEIDYNHAITKEKVHINIENNTILKKVFKEIKGENAIYYSGMEIYKSKKSIEDLIFNITEGSHVKVENRGLVKLPRLNSRNVKDIIINLDYRVEYPYIRTNYGKAMSIKSNGYIYLNKDVPEDSVKDLYLKYPQTLSRTTVINKSLKNIEKLSAKIQTPWVDIIRIGKVKGGKTYIVDNTIIKKAYITYNERKGYDYKKLSSFLDEIYNVNIVID